MKISADIVIVGGGIIGCSVAYRLRKEGYSVLVAEKGGLCQGASRAATGMLAPIKPFAKETPYLKLQLESLALFPSLVGELEEQTGLSCGYQVSGAIRLVEERRREKLERWQEQFSLAPLTLLGQKQLREAVPGIAETETLAIATEQEPQLSPRGFAQAMIEAGRKTGVTFLEECTIREAKREGAGWRLITKEGVMLLCSQVILATGAWSGKVGQLFDLSLPIRPLHGQSIAVPQPDQPLRSMLFGAGIYLCPKQDGTLFIGATEEDTGFCTATSVARAQSLFAKAGALIPALAHGPILRTWAGLRPSTPDRRPLLGQAREGLLLACGHNGFGYLLAPVTAERIAALLSGALPDPMFSLERF